MADASELEGLMTPDAYKTLIEEEEH